MSQVIVAGGGVIGLAIARASARAGLDTCVVDPRPGAGASGVAAGMLAPVTEVAYGEEDLLLLNLASAAAYPDWIAEIERSTGLDTGYRPTGTLMVARDRDDNEALGDLYAFQAELGLDVERLDASATRALEPALAPGVRGGISVKGDHQIDPPALIAALLADATEAGVSFERHACASIETERDRCTGVMLDDGRTLSAERVVIAAGSWSSEIEGLPLDEFPVRPVKGQLLRLASSSEPIPITHNVRGLDVYLVPRADGRLVIGATMEERGFDTTVTAGATFELLRDAYELVPGITEMELVRAEAGVRPGTPDNAPLIGPTRIQGLAAATGHYRNGVLLAPVTAEAIEHWLTAGDVTEVARPFGPERFRREGARA